MDVSTTAELSPSQRFYALEQLTDQAQAISFYADALQSYRQQTAEQLDAGQKAQAFEIYRALERQRNFLVETLRATEELAKEGFVVLPYVQADPVLCKRLEEAGAAAVMPLGAPIGTNKGLRTLDFLEIIIEQSRVPVVVDAGIGAPSHAAQAMEMGADAVLVNTAIAVAGNPVEMARAFDEAVKAGRRAFLAGLGEVGTFAAATSPLTAFLDE